MIQEYSGNQSNQNWTIYHSDLGANTLIFSNNFVGSNTSLNGYTPTATDFQVTSSTIVNGTGNKYIAYLFADNASAGIKCGGFTTSGSTLNINVGFKPEAVLVKKRSGTGGDSHFLAFDDTNNKVLRANLTAPLNDNSFSVTSTGFSVSGSAANQGQMYVYMAVK